MRAGVRRTGFIDKKGRFALTIPFEQAWNFHRAIARITNGDTISLIDRSGRVVSEEKWKYAYEGPYCCGLALVHVQNWYKRVDGRRVPTEPPPAFPPVGKSSHAEDAPGNSAPLELEEWYGYIDERRNLVIPREGGATPPGPFNKAEDFSGGLARVHIGGQFAWNDFGSRGQWVGGTWYYINREGKIVHLYRRDPQQPPDPEPVP